MKRTYGIAIVFLVAGLVVGYMVGFGVYQPQISSLQGDVSGLNDQITDLQGQISALEANVPHLESCAPVNIDWTCSKAARNETFIVTVDVILADGMNRDEAVKVATKVVNVTMGQNVLHQFRSANEDEKGIWTIEFTWGYSSETYLGHWFEAVIDPFNQTVVYNRCK